MRCDGMAGPVRRLVRLSAGLLAALTALGCGSFPVVTSRLDPEPFQDVEIAFLEPGSTDLESVIDELGPAQIIRRGGRLLVYAASVNQKRIVLTGAGDPFKHHFLVVELDGDEIVQRFEVVRPKGGACTSWGVCILRDPWQYHQGLFGIGHDVLPADNDLAVILDTAEADAFAKDSRPDDGECAIYLLNASKRGESSMIMVAADGIPWRYLPEGTFSRLTAAPGRQRIRASFGPPCDEADIQVFELGCEPGQSTFVELGGWKSGKLRIRLQPEATARDVLKERRLIVG